jgi:ABC-2 type transport system permease protein
MNPCFYLVDGFRHGFFGGSGVPPGRSLALAFAALLVTSTVADALLARGYKIRT